MKRLVLFLILLPLLVNAETSGRRDSLRVFAFGQLGVPSAGTALVTTAQVNRIIDQGVQEVSANFPAIEKLDTVTIYDSTQGGALASDFSFIKWAQIISLTSGKDSTAVIPLMYVDPDSLWRAKNGSKGVVDTSAAGRMDRYYHTAAGRLLLYSKHVPSSADDSLIVLVAYYAVDGAMDSDTATTQIDQGYRDALMLWIYSRIEALRKDREMSAYYYGLYEKIKAGLRPGK